MTSLLRISTANVADFRDVRLRALRDSPTAFARKFDDERRLPTETWLARAESNNGERAIGYLALDDATSCGIVRGSTNNDNPYIGWVESMWVDPRFRRRGIGQLLIDAIATWASARGFHKLKLNVTCGNDPAIGFYESVGFSATGNIEPHPAYPELQEAEMERPLPRGSLRNRPQFRFEGLGKK
jgi:GNAT superfamily N-acetyltransferase